MQTAIAYSATDGGVIDTRMVSVTKNIYLTWLSINFLVAVILTVLMHGANNFLLNFLFYLLPLLICTGLGVRRGLSKGINPMISGALGALAGLGVIAILIALLVGMLSLWGF